MSGPLLLDCKPARIDTGMQLEEDGEKLIIHTGTSILLLAEEESIVFKMCNGQHSVKEISRQLSELLNLPAEEVNEQLVPFLEDLITRGLLKWQ